MEKNHLTVNILGVSLTLKSNEPPEYLKQVINYFQDKIDEARETLVTADPYLNKNCNQALTNVEQHLINNDRVSTNVKEYSTKVNPDTSLNKRSLKILIMAGLNISEELLKERNSRMKHIESDVNPEELEEFTARMINKIDKSLMEQ